MPDDNGKHSETAMNHSIYSADRTTHIKIVAVALVAGIGIAGFGIAVRINSDDGYSQTATSPAPAAGRTWTLESNEGLV
jgi:hypothetical protein